MTGAPTTTTIQQGASASMTVTVSRTNYTGSVTITVENLPSGVTAALSNVATNGSQTAIASTTATLTMPDFTGVTGWSDSWGPSTTLPARWSSIADGGDTHRTRCREGARAILASAIGTH